MKTISINELYTQNYSINILSGLKQFWRNTNHFNCFNRPKTVNILLYLNGLKAEYTYKSGQKLYAKSGDIVYAPLGSEYDVLFYNIEKDGYTIGLNFFIYDETQTPFIFSEDILIFNSPKNADYQLLFSKVDVFSEATISCRGKMKAGMYDIISMLSELCHNKRRNKFEIISRAITYLENNPDTGLDLREIADLCNISPSYFRKLFREYAGISPKEYIMNRRIEKAMLYLEYESMAINEIAEHLHFSDAAYFTKQFRQRTGLTPSEYRKRKTGILTV